jgi:peptidoglycan/xylan/chitin deacetylase (PgdA/CDA1 family)
VPDTLILSYHAVSPDWPSPLAVLPQALEAQVAGLQRRGYRAVTLEEAVVGRPSGDVVALTFDDAYANVLEHGLPILERLGAPATIFPPTDWIGRDEPMVWPGIGGWVGGPHEDELRPASWEDLRRLRAAGWEIGSHTCSHPWLSQVSSDEELHRELRASRERVESEVGAPCTSLAYPFGDVDERVLAATRAAGYTAAVTVPDRMNATDPLLAPRIGVYRHDDGRSFALKVSPRLRRLRETPIADPLLRSARRVLSTVRG